MLNKSAIEAAGCKVATIEEVWAQEDFQKQCFQELIGKIDQVVASLYRDKKQANDLTVTSQDLPQIKNQFTVEISGAQFYRGDLMQALESSGMVQALYFSDSELLSIFSGALARQRQWGSEVNSTGVGSIPKFSLPEGSLAEQKSYVISYFSYFSKQTRLNKKTSRSQMTNASRVNPAMV